MSTGFDLSKANDVAEREDRGQVVHIHDELRRPMFFGPEGKRQPVTITVVGSYSGRFRRAQETMRERDVQLARKGQEWDGDQRALEFLALLCVDWSGFVDGGKEVPCEPEYLVRVFEAAPWIRAQVDRGVTDHEGFLERSSAA